MRLNGKIILHLMGLLLLCNGAFMMVAALISVIYKDGVTTSITLAAIVTMMIGLISMFFH